MMRSWFLPVFAATLLALETASTVSADTPGPVQVHAFFYAWYGNPESDGKWLHWDHEILQHWDANRAKHFAQGKYEPPDDAGTTYWPMRGLYSSTDHNVLAQQMVELRDSGVGVVAVSWWGRPDHSGAMDAQGVATDRAIRPLLEAAEIAGLKLVFHVEPYTGRSVESVRTDLVYLIDQYSSSRAFYRDQGSGRPLVYMYDSYLTTESEWQRLLNHHGDVSIRGSPIDVDMIGLVVEKKHLRELARSGFDGIYTYFATEGATYGSTWDNWPEIATFAESRSMIFIPCVGPGYDDTRIRPWNGIATRMRESGGYYKRSWDAAKAVDSRFIAITSYNEWGEGTQIEPTIPYSVKNGSVEVKLADYTPSKPSLYMDLTRTFSAGFHPRGAAADDHEL